MSNICVLYRGISDPRITWYVKLFTLVIIAYVVSPIDLIPDFIPILGLLDEVILVPIALSFIVRLIPGEIYNELSANKQVDPFGNKIKFFGGILILTIWSAVLAFIYVAFF